MINDCARFLALEKNENIVVTVHIMIIILMVVIIECVRCHTIKKKKKKYATDKVKKL